jgi:hypothetical protein
MKRLAALLLCLSACGSQESDANGANEAPDPAAEALAAANLLAADEAQDPAVLEARVERAMSGILRDPGSARYASIRAGMARSICGEVDSKQEDGRRGGFRPFVVTPEGVAVVSTTTGIGFGDPADIFPDYYIRWCASPEELIRLGPAIRTPPPAPLDLNIQAEIPDDSLLAPSPDRPGPAPARPPRPPRADGDDSFFNSVVRKDE